MKAGKYELVVLNSAWSGEETSAIIGVLYIERVYLPSKIKTALFRVLNMELRKPQSAHWGTYLATSLQLANKHVEFNLFHLYEN